MAFPYSGPNSNAERVAEQIDQLTASALALASAWRTSINSGASLDSMQAQEVYQALVSLRAYVQTNKTAPGLAGAYLRRFSNLPNGFDPRDEWTAANAAIVNFGQWFQANWSERTTSGKLAFAQPNADNGVLERFPIDLNPAKRAALIGLLDAVLAAFAPG